MREGPSPPKHTEQPNTPEEQELLAEAGDLLRAPYLLAQLEAVMREQGLAGDCRPSLICYLAIASRHFDLPVNVHLLGTSAVGKNRKLDYARRLHPPEACHYVSASSERALIYFKREDEDVFKHKMVIFGEADSLPDDGAAASAMRSLVFDQAMTYQVTEKTAGGRFMTSTIKKNGPTGLITTGTKPLPPQLRTRVLEVRLEEREEEIRQVLVSLAQEGEAGPTPDLRPFVAHQEWLAAYGCKAVTLPYGELLARLIPARAAVIQRHFRLLLTFIRTIAFIHQLQRDRTENGAVIATLEDYKRARSLLSPTFDATASDGVTAPVRETVEAIQDGEVLSLTELAGRLGLAKSTTSNRVKAALAGSWLVNQEWRRGRPWRLRRGEPLPSETHALPSMEEIEEASTALSDEEAR